MFQSVREQMNGRRAEAPEVNMAPLIDMVFILLIFFLVTTRFIKDTGIKVDKPEAVSSQTLQSESMRIAVSPSGAIFLEGEQFDLIQLRKKVREFVLTENNPSIAIFPDQLTSSGRLVEVMDTVKLGGAKDIAVGTNPKTRR